MQALDYEGLLRACLFRYTRNLADVEELLQETYARLLTLGADQNARIDSIRGFALTVARNAALDWMRHKHVVPIELVADMEALDVMDEEAQVETIVNSRQELGILIEAVRDLSDRCRQVFTLRKVYGYTVSQISAYLGISPRTVEDHLKDAARRIAQIPEKDSLPQRRYIFNRLFRKKQRV